MHLGSKNCLLVGATFHQVEVTVQAMRLAEAWMGRGDPGPSAQSEERAADEGESLHLAPLGCDFLSHGCGFRSH